MNVEVQILKHLPRSARGSISFIDRHCSEYRNLFAEVTSYECCKDLHLGLITTLTRKSLLEISKIVGVVSGQALHHFVAKSPWSIEKLRHRRPERTVAAVEGKAIKVIIDKTGDRKKADANRAEVSRLVRSHQAG